MNDVLKFGVTTVITVVTIAAGFIQFGSTYARSVQQPFLETQTDRCFAAAESAARLATTVDADTWKKAREEFWMLYWGPLAIVEDVAPAADPDYVGEVQKTDGAVRQPAGAGAANSAGNAAALVPTERLARHRSCLSNAADVQMARRCVEPFHAVTGSSRLIIHGYVPRSPPPAPERARPRRGAIAPPSARRARSRFCSGSPAGRTPRRSRARRRIPHSVGAKMRFAISIWSGWISDLPSMPSARACRHSASNRARSRKSLQGPSITSRPWARAAATICMNQGTIGGAAFGKRHARRDRQVVCADDKGGERHVRLVAERGDGGKMQERLRRLDHRPDLGRLERIRLDRARRRQSEARPAPRPSEPGSHRLPPRLPRGCPPSPIPCRAR